MIKNAITRTLLIILCFMAFPALANEPIWDGNKVNLESQKLTEGVYAVIPTGATKMAAQGVPIATTGGFVTGKNGVLVIDSMLNKRLAHQMMDLVKAETNKPILYLVNTSYHGDHSYGNYEFPKDVTIIQHANTKDYIDSSFKADTEFMRKNFGAGRGIEEVVPRTGDILIAENSAVTVIHA